MIVVLAVALFSELVAAASAFSHVVSHAILWAVDPDTFLYGACIDCGPERYEAACERRQAATGRYHR